jgi:hypothetical protein
MSVIDDDRRRARPLEATGFVGRRQPVRQITGDKAVIYR